MNGPRRWTDQEETWEVEPGFLWDRELFLKGGNYRIIYVNIDIDYSEGK